MQHWAPHPTCCPGVWWQRQGEEAEASAEPVAPGPLQRWECRGRGEAAPQGCDSSGPEHQEGLPSLWGWGTG